MLEVPPPEGEDEEQPAGCHADLRGGEPERRGLLHGDGGGGHAFAQHDQGEESVALADVLGVPRRAPASPFGERRDDHVGRRQDEEDHVARLVGQEQSSDPPELHQRDAHGVPPCGRPPGGIVVRGPQPLGHERHPHHDVADGRDREVALAERRGDPGGQDQDPDDLDKRQKPVGHVVDVVGRGEPREVHPGPPDGEEDHEVALDPRHQVVHGARLGSAPAPPAETATTKQRSKSSSRGVEVRWGSSVSRATHGSEAQAWPGRQTRAGRGSCVSRGGSCRRRCPADSVMRPGPDIGRSMTGQARTRERQKPPERTRGAFAI